MVNNVHETFFARRSGTLERDCGGPGVRRLMGQPRRERITCIILARGMFGSQYWHKDKVRRDTQKAKTLLMNGWRVIRGREKPLQPVCSGDVHLKRISGHNSRR